jgi:protein TonB
VNDFEEPSIPPHWRRPLTAAWVSLAVHAAVLVLVQVAPPAAVNLGAPAIEARLAPAAPPMTERAPEEIEEAPKDAPPPPPQPALRPEPVRVAPVKPEPETAVPVPPPAPVEAPSEAAPVSEPVPEPPPERATATSLATAAPATAPREQDTTDAPEQAASPSPAPAAAITSAVDLTYYNVRELDVQPRALREIVPDYPSQADRQRLSGKVRLQLKLEADGRISDIEVVSATPPGVFDASTIEAFRAARFAPAQKAGRPVRARVVIEVLYDWEGRMRRQ